MVNGNMCVCETVTLLMDFVVVAAVYGQSGHCKLAL
jgi:hypothetical protein